MWRWSKCFLKTNNDMCSHKRYNSTISSTKKLVAICQMTTGPDKAKNLEITGKLIADASNNGAQMIFFPEACDFMCNTREETLTVVEPFSTGSITTKYRELAAKHNVWLSMGGVHEQDTNNPNKLHNAHLILDNKGNTVQIYRKLHLFDVNIPGKVDEKESDFVSKGEHIVTPVDTPIGKLGLAICYDLRFSELSTTLAKLNANVLTYPAAFTQPTGQAHWHILIRTRAIENQCYVIAAAQQGEHSCGRKTFGHALCVDPWGTVLADCGQESPSFRIVDIDHTKLDEVRQNMPVFQHRRQDIYSLEPLRLRNFLPYVYNEKPKSSTKSNPKQKFNSPEQFELNQTLVFGHNQVPLTCVFYRSQLTYACVNLRCVVPGHVLVIPLRLAERNKDLTDKEAMDFFRTIRLIQRLMEQVHKADATVVTIQDGPDAGQTVNHCHCHIIPRKRGDFINEDLFHLAMATHDGHIKTKKLRPPLPRTLQEREAEAEMLRKEMLKIMKPK